MHYSICEGEAGRVASAEDGADPTVTGSVNYLGPMTEKPRYFDVDHSRDRLIIDSRAVTISDLRSRAEAPSLDREGFSLIHHPSAVPDFSRYGEGVEVHRRETELLLREVSGADHVVLTTPAAFRISQKSPLRGKARSTTPAPHVHVDFSNATARRKAVQMAPGGIERVRRFAHYNVWRVLSPPPQDSSLAVCDARSVDSSDLVPVDVVSDTRNASEWSFEGLLVRHNPKHRWGYWSNMHSEEALIFKTHDSDPAVAHCVPHAAFDDPGCPHDAPPRVSVEIRGLAFWFV
jgi:hypothetical protein